MARTNAKEYINEYTWTWCCEKAIAAAEKFWQAGAKNIPRTLMNWYAQFRMDCPFDLPYHPETHKLPSFLFTLRFISHLVRFTVSDEGWYQVGGLIEGM